MRFIAIWLLALSPFLYAGAPDVRPSVDLGWIHVVQGEAGWSVLSSTQFSRNGTAFQVSDVILSIDGRELAALNALSVARLLNTVTVDARSSTVLRGGTTVRLSFLPSNDVINHLFIDTNFRRSIRNIKWYGRDEPLPSFDLPDVNGRNAPVRFQGKWSLLRVGSLWCDSHDLDAFNEIAKSPEVQVIAISIGGEEAHNLNNVMVENGYTFPLLVAGGRRIGGPRDTDFTVTTIPPVGTATYVLVSPKGDIVFVSAGKHSLSAAWSRYKTLAPAN